MTITWRNVDKDIWNGTTSTSGIVYWHTFYFASPSLSWILTKANTLILNSYLITGIPEQKRGKANRKFVPWSGSQIVQPQGDNLKTEVGHTAQFCNNLGGFFWNCLWKLEGIYLDHWCEDGHQWWHFGCCCRVHHRFVQSTRGLPSRRRCHLVALLSTRQSNPEISKSEALPHFSSSHWLIAVNEVIIS